MLPNRDCEGVGACADSFTDPSARGHELRTAARHHDNRTMQSSSTGKFRVGLVQMSCAPDPNENLEKARWRIREAAAGGAQIVCLQELFRSQYFCREVNAELFALAEPIPGPTTETFPLPSSLY